METKLYIRDGKRFKYVPNMIGMYWNGIILTKEKMQDSVAVVIEQHYDHVVMASRITSISGINWHEAKNWCESKFDGKGRLPSNTELANLKKYITSDITRCTLLYVWGEEYSANNAWTLDWRDGYVSTLSKNHSLYIRAIAITDIPILNLI